MEDKKSGLALLELSASMCHLASAEVDKNAILKFAVARKPPFDGDLCMSMRNELARRGWPTLAPRSGATGRKIGCDDGDLAEYAR